MTLRVRILLFVVALCAIGIWDPASPLPILLGSFAYLVLLFPVLDAEPRRPAVADPPDTPAADYSNYTDFTDPMLLAATAAWTNARFDALRWMGYADQELARLREELGLPTKPPYAVGRPTYDGPGKDGEC